MSARDHDPSLRCADAGAHIPRSPDLGLFAQCLAFVQEQSAGEWGDVVEHHDALKLAQFVAQKQHEAAATAAPAATVPPNEWLHGQAQILSSAKDENSVGALAWNLSVAFTRWQDVEAARAAPRVAAQVDGASSRAEHDQ